MKPSEAITLILSFVAVVTMLIASATDNNILAYVGIGLLISNIILIIIGLTKLDWESGNAPGGLGGP